MSTQANKQLIRDTWAAISAGDHDGFLGNLSDDVSWTFFGSHRFAGTFKSKGELVEKLFTPLGGVLDGGISVEILALYADGDHVIMEAKGDARSKDGKDYNNDYCLVIQCADGKIKAVREYLDSELVTAVFGS